MCNVSYLVENEKSHVVEYEKRKQKRIKKRKTHKSFLPWQLKQ